MSRLRVTVVLFPNFELLDVAGPLEMFLMVESVLRDKDAVADRTERGYELVMTALDPPLSPIKSNQGPALALDRVGVPQDESMHALFVPGGMGCRPLFKDAAYLDKLRQASTQARHTLTVCTGSALLSCTGVLDGRMATSNKRAWDMVTALTDKVAWQSSARWVVDGPFWTSSGVAAGMDMALAFIEFDFGRAVAEAVAKRVEYTWNQDQFNDPFRAMHRSKV